jgi:excisionase family DNA binding protein
MQAELAERLLSVPEAAAVLGMSERWMWTQVLGRQLPTVRLGRRRLIRREDLDAFISSRVDRDEAEAA